MTTSGTVTYSPVITKILYGALRMVGAYASDDAPRAQQVVDAKDALDMMLKGWQVDGALWLKRFVRVKLVAGQNSYDIGPGSADTVYTGDSGTTAYTQRPTRIYTPTRLATDGTEVPLCDPMSRGDWTALPNKTTTGTVVQVYYDPQLTMGKLYVWPTPVTGVTDYVKLTVDRIIEDVGTEDTYDIDVPPEWTETVKYNLALRLCPEYPPGLDADNRKIALALKEKMDSYQRSGESVFFQPGR